MRPRSILLLLSIFSTLVSPGAALAQRSGARRIGLSQDALIRVAGGVNNAETNTDPELVYLSTLSSLKKVFSQRLQQTGNDFVNVSGYQYCTKTVSAMGLLAVLGDTEARAIATKTLLLAAAPFSQPVAEDALDSVLRDTQRPYAERIYAYNKLREGNFTFVPPSRGDPIYLGVGALGLCLGVGYDWLYETLTPDERRIVERAVKEVLLWSNNIDASFFSATALPEQRDSNWNAVMNGGSGVLGISALNSTAGFSCADILSQTLTPQARRAFSLDQLGKERICRAVVALRYYWKTFTASGAYPEGPSYWFYGLQPYSLFASSLMDALGRKDLALTNSGNLEKSVDLQADLMNHTDGFWLAKPSGVSKVGTYSFADSAETLLPASFPFLFVAKNSLTGRGGEFGWRLLRQQIMNETIHSPTAWAGHSGDWSRIFSLLLKPPVSDSTSTKQRLAPYTSADHLFDIVRLAAFVSGGDWTVYQKGGDVYQPHAHLDSASFILRIGEENWISDLGYELSASGAYPSGYFSLPPRNEYAKSLRFFRKNDLSHNIVTLPSRPINLAGRAKLVSSSEGKNPSDGAPYAQARWDTTSLYQPEVISASRVLTLTQRGRYTTLDVVDNLDFPTSVGSSVNSSLAVWRVVTCVPATAGADVTVDSSRVVRIAHGTSDVMTMQVVRPVGASPAVSSADPNSNPRIKRSLPTEVENPNTGCSVIEIPGNAAQLTPVNETLRRLTFSVRFQKEV